MRTVGHKLPRNAPPNETVAYCAYCGTLWHRSKLRKDGSGQLYCPQEGKGRDAITLQRDDEKAARQFEERTYPPTDGQYYKPDTEGEYVADLDRTDPRIEATVPVHLSAVDECEALVIRWSKWVDPYEGQLHVFNSSGLVQSVDANPLLTRDGWVTTTAITGLAAGTYWVLIDDDAFRDKNFVQFPGIADSKTWRFTVL